MIKFIGHSGFIFSNEELKIGIDLWLDNPKNKLKPSDIPELDYILLTHDHGDHGIGNIAELSSEKTQIITNVELANSIRSKLPELKIIAANIGGEIKTSDNRLKLYMTQALHSANIGIPTGFVIKIENQTIYHMGDAAIMSDFRLINELYKPDIILVPIGGHFTMGIDEASLAVKMFDAGTIIPMHYGTFPLIDVDPLEFKTKVEAESGKKVMVLKINEEIELTDV